MACRKCLALPGPSAHRHMYSALSRNLISARICTTLISRRCFGDSTPRSGIFTKTSSICEDGIKELSARSLLPCGGFGFSSAGRRSLLDVCNAGREGRESQEDVVSGEDAGNTAAAQLSCWAVTAIYVGWLFILPYAPGDPVWAVSPATLQMLIDLSLNFFFVLPIAGYVASFVGIPGLAPVAHPVDEGLFNFVIAWTLLFAPLLFTDRKRDRFSGSIEAVLAPYMAIRMNKDKATRRSTEDSRHSPLQTMSEGLTRGAKYVGIVGAVVGLVSVAWALYGRPEGGFGNTAERLNYFWSYVTRERLAYAFLWDIILYTVFQPWLIGDNLSNVAEEKRDVVRVLRFVPYLGLVSYALGLRQDSKKLFSSHQQSADKSTE